MSGIEFREWLQDRLNQKDWNYSELADRAGVSRGAIANVMRGERSPGPELCVAIAKAFELPEVEVFQVAGLLPPSPELTPLMERAIHYLAQLHPEDQERIVLYLEVLVSRYKRENIRP